MRAALLMLAACAAAPPPAKSAPAPTPSAPPTRTEPEASIKLVVAEVVARFDECSGLGGEHYVLKLHDGSNRVVHAGGHGLSLDLIPIRSTQHAFVIAEVHPDPVILGSAGWCLHELESYPFTGHARRILQVADLAAARTKLRELVRRGGLPPADHDPPVTRLIEDPTRPCTRAVCNVRLP